MGSVHGPTGLVFKMKEPGHDKQFSDPRVLHVKHVGSQETQVGVEVAVESPLRNSFDEQSEATVHGVQTVSTSPSHPPVA